MSPPIEQKIDTSKIAHSWLASLAALLTSTTSGESQIGHDINALFLPNGWLRDSLTLSWDSRSLRGHEAISSYISTNLLNRNTPVTSSNSNSNTDLLPANPSKNLSAESFVIDEELRPSPELTHMTPAGDMGIEFGFRYSGDVIVGRGYARLLLDAAAGAEAKKERTRGWKALTVYLAAQDLVGHEEMGPEDGTYDGHRRAWKDVYRERREEVEREPDVIVVGSGHCGLNMAATLKQTGLKTLLIEKNDRVGDSWRKRYPMLSLHTPRSYSGLKYQTFPRTWPIYTPRDKFADWLEQYARMQDLCVWTRSTIIPKPTYNSQTKRWDIEIDRDGTRVRLNPRHIVLATGFANEPRVPDIPGKEKFGGKAFHASLWKGAGEGEGQDVYAGKNVVVVGLGRASRYWHDDSIVGAANTAADICQELYNHISESNKGGSVTMIQRSSTCVVTRESVAKKMSRFWPDRPDVDLALGDFKSSSMPLGLVKMWEIGNEANAWREGEEMYEGLRKVGFKLNMGKDGSGQFIMVFERGGGYWLDVGCAELISSGKVKLKQGHEIVKYTRDGLVFDDGSVLPADVVIFATGYDNGTAHLEETFGPEVANHVSSVGGVDEEEEAQGIYRQSGYPGLWFAITGFGMARALAKQLTILIKASSLGLLEQEVPA